MKGSQMNKNLPYTVTLADCYSSLVNGQWHDPVKVKRFASESTAITYADKLRDQGIKTTKGYNERWIIEVVNESTSRMLKRIQF